MPVCGYYPLSCCILYYLLYSYLANICREMAGRLWDFKYSLNMWQFYICILYYLYNIHSVTLKRWRVWLYSFFYGRKLALLIQCVFWEKHYGLSNAYMEWRSKLLCVMTMVGRRLETYSLPEADDIIIMESNVCQTIPGVCPNLIIETNLFQVWRQKHLFLLLCVLYVTGDGNITMLETSWPFFLMYMWSWLCVYHWLHYYYS